MGKIDRKKIRIIKRMRGQGHSQKEIADELGVSQSLISMYLKKIKQEERVNLYDHLSEDYNETRVNKIWIVTQDNKLKMFEDITLMFFGNFAVIVEEELITAVPVERIYEYQLTGKTALKFLIGAVQSAKVTEIKYNQQLKEFEKTKEQPKAGYQ